MPSWLMKLRDVVWSAVVSVALAVTTVVIAIATPQSIGPIIAFASASITAALLAQRS